MGKMKNANIDLQKELEASESEGRAKQRKIDDLRQTGPLEAPIHNFSGGFG